MYRDELIHIRTKLFHTDPSESERVGKYAGRTPEVHGLSKYTPLDDARDIAWKKYSEHTEVLKKVREQYTVVSVSIFGCESESWDFFTTKNPRSKYGFYRDFVHCVQESGKKLGYSVHDFGYRKTLPDLQNTRGVIFLIGSAIDLVHIPQFAPLPHQDIIWINLLHPTETLEETLPIFEGKILQTRKYRDALRENIDQFRYTMGTQNTDTLEITTNEPIAPACNSFFRHRYG